MKINVNAKITETNAKTLFELKKSLYGESDMVVIADGFQYSEDVGLDEISSVVFIKRGVMPCKEELECMLSARNTPFVQDKLKAAAVGIAGLGGLGSLIALSLARSGVGFLHLVDFDIVEPSNLNRQQYNMSHLGMYKAQALARQIAEINPFVSVKAENIKITGENAAKVFENEEIVCEAFDKPENKAMLVNALLSSGNKKVVCASGMAGFASSNDIITKRISRNLYICGDGVSAAKPGMGLMAPRVAVCAGHEANMALRLILEEKDV